MVGDHGRSFGHNGGAGFTLLELLVSVSIISLLIGIVAPGLTAARRSSRSSVCLSNLRQLAVGCAAYSNTDPNSLILPAHPISDTDELHHDGKYDWGGKSGSRLAWNGTYGPEGPRSAPTRPLNRQLFGEVAPGADLPVFRCPGDPGSSKQWPCETWWWTPELQSTSYYDVFGSSYIGNALRHHESNGLEAKPPFLIIGVFLRPSTRIPASGETVLLSDANAQVWRMGTMPEYYSYGVLDEPGWHGRPLERNIAYVDGHAVSVALEREFPSGDWHADPEGYPFHVRSGRTRWDCRPEPLVRDLPDTPSEVRLGPRSPAGGAAYVISDNVKAAGPKNKRR